MNTVEISRKLNCVKNFLGVFPRDLLPCIVKYPCFSNINSHKSSDPGEHWVAVHFTRTKFAEYFDCFGLPPLHTTIFNFISVHAHLGFAYNNTTLQHILLDTCEKYCITHVCLRSEGYSICDVISVFSKNLPKNDIFVKHITRKISC